jgi:hypothetical protein
MPQLKVGCIRVTHPCAGRHQVLLPVLPLDLHVLSLPLAFILSQDQTLHCIKILNCSKIYYSLNCNSGIFAYLSFLLQYLQRTCPLLPHFSALRGGLLFFFRFSDFKGVQKYDRFSYQQNKVINNNPCLTHPLNELPRTISFSLKNGTAKIHSFSLSPTFFCFFFDLFRQSL